MYLEGKLHQVCPHCGADIEFDFEATVGDNYGDAVIEIDDAVVVTTGWNSTFVIVS